MSIFQQQRLQILDRAQKVPQRQWVCPNKSINGPEGIPRPQLDHGEDWGGESPQERPQLLQQFRQHVSIDHDVP